MIRLLLATFLIATPAFAVPVGKVIRTNIPGLKNLEVSLGQSMTVPKATEEKDFWVTVKYYETCQEETHINSRRDEDVVVTYEKVLEGDCRDEPTLD